MTQFCVTLNHINHTLASENILSVQMTFKIISNELKIVKMLTLLLRLFIQAKHPINLMKSHHSFCH